MGIQAVEPESDRKALKKWLCFIFVVFCSHMIYLYDEHPNLSPYSFIISPSAVAHFLACCDLSYCGIGERFKVIVSLALSLYIPRFPFCHPCSHHVFIPPCYSDMSIQLTFSFPGPRSVSPSWSCSPLSKSSCCVNSFPAAWRAK